MSSVCKPPPESPHSRRVKIWLDAHLPPSIAPWLYSSFGVEVVPIRDLGLRDEEDANVFKAAKVAEAVFMTKDSDFLILLERHGPPPQVVWLTCGNTSNEHLRQILQSAFPRTLELLKQGEPLVEVSQVPPSSA